MKRIVQLISIALLLLTAGSAWAQTSDFVSDGIYYNITGTSPLTVEVTNSSGGGFVYSGDYSGIVTIPATVSDGTNTYSVTSISNGAFFDCNDLIGIDIPESVTTIENEAFRDCRSLTSITIPNSVTSIKDYAFNGCSNLTSITLSNGLTSINNGVFYNCSSLTSIEIPENITSIGEKTFSNCTGLTNITLSESITNIGEGAFMGCHGLTNIALPGSITSINYGTFYGCSGLTNINIPEGITSIGDWAFYDCSNLTSINIPKSVTSIGERAFIGCSSLVSINIPKSVINIGERAFSSCSSLVSINTETGNPAYKTVEGVLFSVDGDTIHAYPIGRPGHTYTIPDGVVSISTEAFSSCNNLTSITLPTSLTNIGDWAFSDCKNLTSITPFTGVTSIGIYAFYGCISLASITLSDDLTSIGSGTFTGCTSLTSINIPANVVFIGGYAFQGSHLTNITLQSTTPPELETYYDGPYEYLPGATLTDIYVPSGSEETYKTAPVWSNYAHLIKYDPTSSEQISNTALAAYPNPTKDLITVTGLTTGNIIRLYNLSGAQVATYTAPTTEMTIDLSNLSSGMYFLNVEGKTVRVIKE